MTVKRKCSGMAYHSLGNWGQWDPCSRKATVEHEGKWYCWQHDPERVEADKKKRQAAYDAKWDREDAKYACRALNARLSALVTEETAALLDQLADGRLDGDKVIWEGDAQAAARALAARIREALEEETNV